MSPRAGAEALPCRRERPRASSGEWQAAAVHRLKGEQNRPSENRVLTRHMSGRLILAMKAPQALGPRGVNQEMKHFIFRAHSSVKGSLSRRA